MRTCFVEGLRLHLLLLTALLLGAGCATTNTASPVGTLVPAAPSGMVLPDEPVPGRVTIGGAGGVGPALADPFSQARGMGIYGGVANLEIGLPDLVHFRTDLVGGGTTNGAWMGGGRLGLRRSTPGGRLSGGGGLNLFVGQGGMVTGGVDGEVSFGRRNERIVFAMPMRLGLAWPMRRRFWAPGRAIMINYAMSGNFGFPGKKGERMFTFAFHFGMGMPVNSFGGGGFFGGTGQLSSGGMWTGLSFGYVGGFGGKARQQDPD